MNIDPMDRFLNWLVVLGAIGLAALLLSGTHRHASLVGAMTLICLLGASWGLLRLAWDAMALNRLWTRKKTS